MRLLLDLWLPVAVPELVPVPRPVLDSLSFEGGSVMVLSELEEVRLPPFLEGVGVGCALVSSELSFCRTINASNSGSHLGHGHAAEKVAKTKKRMEKIRLRCVLIVKLLCCLHAQITCCPFVPPQKLVCSYPNPNFQSTMIFRRWCEEFGCKSIII